METLKGKLLQLKYTAQLYAAANISKYNTIHSKNSLYKNTNFRLIHVQINDGAMSLTAVIPALDKAICKQVEAQGYYAASHMWGDPKHWKPWTSHGITGPNGEPLPVQMRQEKQETLLSLLQEHPGFWWIDVFCAHVDTQLHMMGDVYRFCRICFALLDFPENDFQKVEAVNQRLQSLESMDKLVEGYRRRIDGKTGSANQSWNETLDDLLGEWYDQNPDDIRALANFFDCKWFTRVWTLQEYLLPSSLVFISESDTKINTIDRSVIEQISDSLGSVVNTVLNSYIAGNFDEHPSLGYLSFTKKQHKYASITPGVSRCYFDMSRIIAFEIIALFVYIFRGHHGFNLMALRYVSFEVDLLTVILVHFARLPRTCLFPCDYIYGVVGLLDIEIPNSKDEHEVWAAFRTIIQGRAPYLTVPEQIDLANAHDMQDVYNTFIGEDISEQLNYINDMFETAGLVMDT